jgi:GNAT superfamily N-acetyltransferase
VAGSVGVPDVPGDAPAQGGGVRVLPATADRFPDLALVLGPKNPDGDACWCLTYRLPSAENRALRGRERAAAVAALSAEPIAPGVLGYLDGVVVGWAGVAPRARLHAFAHSRRIPHVDDLPIWSVWCFRVRAGYTRRGVAAALLGGAVSHAREQGAPAIEGYPVDNAGQRVDRTMAYVGTRGMFERAGFTKAADTASVSGGFPRVVMRLDLR